jgi:uncharacterized membrane protein
MENVTVNEGKPMAIISYLTFIGTIIAFIMNSDKKNSFASFHIRQALGFVLLGLVISSLRFIGIDGLVAGALWIGFFLLWLIGIFGAIQGEEKEIPFLGDKFQEWFKQIG